MHVVKPFGHEIGADNGIWQSRAIEVQHAIRPSCDWVYRNSAKIAGIHKIL
jgi:hypothetical protein